MVKGVDSEHVRHILYPLLIEFGWRSTGVAGQCASAGTPLPFVTFRTARPSAESGSMSSVKSLASITVGAGAWMIRESTILWLSGHRRRCEEMYDVLVPDQDGGYLCG